MAEGEIPRQRTGEDNEKIIARVGEQELEVRFNNSPAPLTRELDAKYGPDGWGAREATPITRYEQLTYNMGLLTLEIYEK